MFVCFIEFVYLLGVCLWVIVCVYVFVLRVLCVLAMQYINVINYLTDCSGTLHEICLYYIKPNALQEKTTKDKKKEKRKKI